jgi:hypothetical protein
MLRIPRMCRQLNLGGYAVIVAVALTALVELSGAAGQKKVPWWNQKDWTRWSFTECENILNSSPWGNHIAEDYGTSADDRGRVTVGYSFQFRSAIPIQEAKVRYRRASNGYDKMDPEKKRAFDAKYPGLLNESEARPIVIYVANSGTPETAQAGEAELRLSDGTAVLPTEVTGKVEQFGNSITYTFPRIVNGKPAYAAGDKEIEIFFGGSLWVDKQGNLLPHTRAAFPFDSHSEIKIPIQTLMYKGQIEY